jgi:hypothetical protein
MAQKGFSFNGYSVFFFQTANFCKAKVTTKANDTILVAVNPHHSH